MLCVHCSQVIQLAEYRAQLYEYLKSRMAAIAPNLTVLVGELVGARLIAHAGSLMTLAKYPASTVQILGAEKVCDTARLSSSLCMHCLALPMPPQPPPVACRLSGSLLECVLLPMSMWHVFTVWLPCASRHCSGR